MCQDPVELELGFLLIKKEVLGGSILVSRCVPSKTSQVGGMLELGAGELGTDSQNFRAHHSR